MKFYIYKIYKNFIKLLDLSSPCIFCIQAFPMFQGTQISKASSRPMHKRLTSTLSAKENGASLSDYEISTQALLRPKPLLSHMGFYFQGNIFKPNLLERNQSFSFSLFLSFFPSCSPSLHSSFPLFLPLLLLPHSYIWAHTQTYL